MAKARQSEGFFAKKGLRPSLKLYFVDAMGAMAQGLFASLLLGTILGTLGKYIPFLSFLSDVAAFAQNGYVVGAAIGIAVAYALKAEGLLLYTAAVVGAIGYSLGDASTVINEKIYTAGPAGAFVAVIVAVELTKIVHKSTKVDIIITPLCETLIGYGISLIVCPSIARAMYWLGNFINTATEMQPFLMGVIIAVIVGMILTLPISSAAICAMIGISGLAGGAATAGCCAQMIGFAVMSYRENKVGGLVAQGLGTSMLQMGNIVRRPQIWLPTIFASAITGPLATMLFKLENASVAAGMGTCGLVGPLGIVTTMEGRLDAWTWIGIVVICFALPAVLSLVFSELMRKLGWIKEGDLKLEL